MMHSGAAHDTVSIVDLVPSADGLRPVQGRHKPLAAGGRSVGRRRLGTEVMLNAIRKFVALPGWRNDGREPPPRS